MEFITTIIRFLHIALSILAIAGLIGRQFTMAQAQRTDDIKGVVQFVKLGGRFEQMLVRPATLLLFALGILLAVRAGWPLLGFLQGARANWLLASVLLYLAVFPLIFFVFVPRGKIFTAALESATATGQVTAALKAAFNDGAVRAAHYAEGTIVLTILFLMVVKPF